MTIAPRPRALAVCCALMLAACGGGSPPQAEDADSAAPTEEASDTAPATDLASESSEAASEAAGEDAIDPEAAELAEAGAFGLKELGSDWKLYDQGLGLAPYSPGNCDPTVTSQVQAVFDGVLAKHKTAEVYMGATVYVFPSPREVREYIKARNGMQWLECRAEEFSQGQKEQQGSKQWSVKLGAHRPGRDTLEDAYAQFIILYKGEPVGSHILRYVFHHGRVVINVGWEQQTGPSDKDVTNEVSEDLGRAVNAALERVQEFDETAPPAPGG